MDRELEFQQLVLTQLSALNTKMDIVVGTDGNGGSIRDLISRVTNLEQSRKIDEGRKQISNKVIAAVSGLVGAGTAVVLTAVLHAFGIH
jgi:hypothetical protein